MKHFALLFSVVAALVLMPSGAFAKDKYKHHGRSYDRHCDHGSYSRYGGRAYYGRSYYYSQPSYYVRRSYYAPSYYAPSYYPAYRGYYGGRCSSYRGGGVQIVLGF